jgi:hypothetical protein
LREGSGIAPVFHRGKGWGMLTNANNQLQKEKPSLWCLPISMVEICPPLLSSSYQRHCMKTREINNFKSIDSSRCNIIISKR